MEKEQKALWPLWKDASISETESSLTVLRHLPLPSSIRPTADTKVTQQCRYILSSKTVFCSSQSAYRGHEEMILLGFFCLGCLFGWLMSCHASSSKWAEVPSFFRLFNSVERSLFLLKDPEPSKVVIPYRCFS